MILLTTKVPAGTPASASLTLPLDSRTKSRLRVTLDDGREAGLQLERGHILRDGELLSDGQGLVVRIRAAAESLSRVRCSDPLGLARACYHLGNRHVALQISAQWLHYQHDHVLDEMLRGMGLEVEQEEAPFEPEAGAYGGVGKTPLHLHAH